MKKEELKIENEREAKIFMLGMMKGYNDTRINFWGIGYDNDDTARTVRKFTGEMIQKYSDILQLDSLLSGSFSDVESFVKQLSED